MSNIVRADSHDGAIVPSSSAAELSRIDEEFGRELAAETNGFLDAVVDRIFPSRLTQEKRRYREEMFKRSADAKLENLRMFHEFQRQEIKAALEYVLKKGLSQMKEEESKRLIDTAQRVTFQVTAILLDATKQAAEQHQEICQLPPEFAPSMRELLMTQYKATLETSKKLLIDFRNAIENTSV